MNILLIGDPHFKINNTLETNKFVSETLEYVEREKDKIAFIVILGDVLHTHEKIYLQPLCQATNFIKRLAKIKYTFVLVGNHDRLNNKIFLTEEHSLIGLKNTKNVGIIDKTFKFKNFLFVPYVEPGRFQEAIDTIDFDMNEIKAIFAHQEFYGAQMKSIKSEIGDKWDVKLPPIFSGHIHSYQQVQENIFYIGTPYQLNFGESEDKALALLNITSDDYNIERIYLNYIKKKTLIIKAIDLEKLELSKDIMWRLVIEDEVKYIKKILAQPHIKEKIANCQINYKIKGLEKIEHRNSFVNSFQEILDKNLNQLSAPAKSFYASTITSSSSSSSVS